jgi:anti-sigma factor RsiW
MLDCGRAFIGYLRVILSKHGGMAYCVVSDLNQEELATFARMVIAASLPPR